MAKEAVRRRRERWTHDGRHRGAPQPWWQCWGLIWPLVVVLVLGYCTATAVADHISNVREARHLLESGRSAQVTGAQVHISVSTSKGGYGHWAVDGVHVMFEGGPRLGVVLDGVGSTEVGGVDGGERWMPPTPETGYLEPFSIHYAVADDGRVVAMAYSDIADWAGG